MDFDLIDAAGTAAIFKDAGKGSVYTDLDGSLHPVRVFVNPLVEAFVDYPDGSEQQYSLDVLNGTVGLRPGGVIDAGGVRYVLVRRAFDDGVMSNWECRKDG